MKVFFSNYHISVNDQVVNDLLGAGLEVVVPDESFGKKHIGFFANNNEHYDKPGVIKASYEQFISMPPMAIILNCSQMYDDFTRLMAERNNVDKLVLLSSQMGIGNWLPVQADYLITHELEFHRKSNAKYKILYFNRPKLTQEPKSYDQMREAYYNKKICLYVNHFDTQKDDDIGGNFARERKQALIFRDVWNKHTNTNVPFYGYENKDGQLTIEQAHQSMKESMFTLVFKGHETWGQMVNESMMLGTPCIFLNDFIVDMFKQYLITPDTAIIGETVAELITQIRRLTVEQYESLCIEAQAASYMFTNPEIQQGKLRWLFSKIEMDLNS